MRKLLLTICLLAAFTLTASAQRFTDKLDRGLVAVPAASGNFISWRRQANEYYDVTYNLYRGNTLVASGLSVTNFTDTGGNSNSTYQVEAVVNGVTPTKCDAVGLWHDYKYTLNNTHNGYIDITLAAVYDRKGNDVTTNYSPNDAEMADLDGDGQLEIIIKRLNTADAAGTFVKQFTIKDKTYDQYNIYPKNSKEFVVIDAYDVNWQTGAATLMWRIDCGPNMVSSNSTEINIIAYDWNQDGKAEVVLRGADNMIIYKSDGKTKRHEIGDMSANTRDTWYNVNDNGTATGNMAYTHSGAEYLIYMNGETGELIQQVDYPLKRLESNESDLNSAWGDGYGHRSSKYFMGAPFLDGRKASLFLGRGIYTRHKMMALDLDSDGKWDINNPVWTWNCKNSSSPWYGNGYHNFVIADVDEDGRDEIVYGSMVIDDNGKGLHTTGFEHGDAQHVGDFNPYRKGLEFFGCLEDSPYWGCNYRDATTGEVLYKHTGSGDDGRCIMGNFSNTYPGSIGRSVGSTIISSVTNAHVMDPPEDTRAALYWSQLNFRIYWDGDLCSEILNSPGTEREASVTSVDKGRVFVSDGCNMNNDSKNNPCFQGDIIGDWREEIVVRCGNNIRVYTSGIYTDYSMPCLWYDHQYRQAMVWQMMAYNQPPHLSYFLGEMEGITMAPPPLTMEGRKEIKKNGTIDTDQNGKQVLLSNTENTSSSFSIAEGAQPSVIFVNTATHVKGTDENGTTGTKLKSDGSRGIVAGTEAPINYITDRRINLNGTLTGSTRVTKQGNGKLKLSANTTHTYTGKTDVWGGTLECDGTLQNSPVWLNRFARLESAAGTFGAGITADYGSEIQPGGSLTTTTLTMNFGARMVLDINSNDLTADQVNVDNLVINTKTDDVWKNYGPEYLEPVMEFQLTGSAIDATYDLGAVGTITGSLSDITIEGVENATLKHENGHLLLVVGTGSTACPEATFSQSGWQTNSEGILMPVVTVNATPFEYGSETVTPTLSATFTPQGGTPSNVSLIKTLYSEDFEGSANPADYWKRNNSGFIYSPGYTGSEGQCIGITSSNDRGDYTPITADYTNVESYNIEFDAYFNDASKTTDFAVMSKNHWEEWVYNWGYFWRTTDAEEHNPYLFFMRRAGGSTTFTINETTAATLNNSTWYHFTLNVDVTSRTVNYTISQKGNTTPVANGSYTLPEGDSYECDGIYIRNGRYNYAPGGAGIDNIHIYVSYAFTEPGTLTVTSSHQGCTSTDATFTCDYVGAQIGSLGWSTFGCKYPLNLNADGLTAYVISSHVNGYVKLTEVTSVPASTGLLLQGEQGIYTLPIVNGNPAAPASNLLTAVTNAAGTPAPTGSYVLANKASGLGFYSIQQGVAIPAGKAYLTLPANSREVIMIGEATGISEMLMNEENKAVYNLNGQRIAVPRKGIYIINGKKTVVRSAERDAYQGK